MAVRQKLVTTSTVDKDLDHFVNDFNNIAKSLGQEAFAQVDEPLLDELQFYPPVPSGSTYVRTYRLRRGWKAGIVDLGSDKFAFFVTNDVNYTQWVVGSLAQAESAAASFQASFHAANGWFLATKTVKFWFDTYVELLDEGFARELSKFGTISNRRRAFTSKTR
jgi:hypothetical protein